MKPAGDRKKPAKRVDTTEKELTRVNRINDAINEVVGLAQPEIRKNGVKLRVDLCTTLPSVNGDRPFFKGLKSPPFRVEKTFRPYFCAFRAFLPRPPLCFNLGYTLPSASHLH